MLEYWNNGALGVENGAFLSLIVKINRSTFFIDDFFR
jgi:hypothetical protein